MLNTYVLIQTEVGKVAHVAQALSGLDGVQVAEDITGPLRRHRQGPGARSGSAGPADGLPHPAGGRRHPYPDLHGAPSVAACFTTVVPARATAQLWPCGMEGAEGPAGRAARDPQARICRHRKPKAPVHDGPAVALPAANVGVVVAGGAWPTAAAVWTAAVASLLAGLGGLGPTAVVVCSLVWSGRATGARCGVRTGERIDDRGG
jgi:hypothetical protein